MDIDKALDFFSDHPFISESQLPPDDYLVYQFPLLTLLISQTNFERNPTKSRPRGQEIARVLKNVAASVEWARRKMDDDTTIAAREAVEQITELAQVALEGLQGQLIEVASLRLFDEVQNIESDIELTIAPHAGDAPKKLKSAKTEKVKPIRSKKSKSKSKSKSKAAISLPKGILSGPQSWLVSQVSSYGSSYSSGSLHCAQESWTSLVD